MLFVYPRRSLAIPNAIILRGTLSLIFQLPCGTRTRRFSSALVRGPVGAGFPPVRSSDRLIRSAQGPHQQARSEEHTSELQSLMRIPYAVFCLKTNNH